MSRPTCLAPARPGRACLASRLHRAFAASRLRPLVLAAWLALPLLLAPGARAADPAPPAAEKALKDAVSGYQHELVRVMAQTRRYPAEAMQHGWQGTTLLHVGIGADGELADLSIEKSAGHAELDEAALRAARQARLKVAVPEKLRGTAFSAHVRVRFQLDAGADGRAPR